MAQVTVDYDPEGKGTEVYIDEDGQPTYKIIVDPYGLLVMEKVQDQEPQYDVIYERKV